MTANVERIGTMRCGVGESPVWHAGEQALYWTDIPGRTLWRWNVEGHADAWTLPEMAGCIAMTSNGWAMAMETGIFLAPQPKAGAELAPFERLATVEHARLDMRFNDGRSDRQGRFWAGTMVFDTALGLPVGKLYRLDADAARRGRVDAVIDDLIVPNGLAFSPDGKTMYLSDSHASRQMVWAFDYDVDSGTPHNRRVFIGMNAHPGRPDGAAVDADGCYWICGNDAGLVHRFTPDGRLDRSIAIPTSKPAMCAFGGPGFDTLFVTSIAIEGDPLSGATFAVRPGVRGLPEPALHL